MGKKSFNLVFLVSKLSSGLFLAVFLLSVHLPEASSFSPVDHYLINCGCSSPVTVDPNNRRFRGDESSSGSSSVSLSATRSLSVRDQNPSTDLTSSPIYSSARIFTRASNYAFRIRDRGPHLVRLHFHWFNSTKFDIIDVQFHVSAGGFLLLNNLSGQDSLIKEYIVPVDTDELVISFVPAKGGSKLGFVNAIEVISAPKDLISDLAQSVDSNGAVKFSGFSNNALETVYRVNVGGPEVTPFNDSLWRTWLPDSAFLESSSDERVHFSGRIEYQSGRASRQVAPDSVYNTARVIRSKNSTLPNSKIMLSFPVLNGYRYLVRAHFCDIASRASGMLVFNVYVNGYLAEENLHPVLATPFYADLVVDGASGVVTVGVGASKCSALGEVDAVLNGVEVMKVNNSAGSLDGLKSADSVMETRVGFGVLFPVVAVVCLLVAASLLLQKRMFRGRNGVSWSRIPIDVSQTKSFAS